MFTQREVVRVAVALTAFFSWIEVFSTLVLHSETNKKIFTQVDTSNAQLFPLVSRTFALVQSCTGVMRTMCALNFENRIAYLTALATYPLMFAHFVMEGVVYGSVDFNFNIIAVMLIAGTMTVLMAVSYPKLFSKNENEGPKDK